jgi:DNA repair exonuclease SbcCD ATPase subunit
MEHLKELKELVSELEFNTIALTKVASQIGGENIEKLYGVASNVEVSIAQANEHISAIADTLENKRETVEALLETIENMSADLDAAVKKAIAESFNPEELAKKFETAASLASANSVMFYTQSMNEFRANAVPVIQEVESSVKKLAESDANAKKINESINTNIKTLKDFKMGLWAGLVVVGMLAGFGFGYYLSAQKSINKVEEIHSAVQNIIYQQTPKNKR